MSTTKIILTQDIKNLGEEGDVREVKRGFARNFLLPKGMAVDYTLQNRNTLEKRKAIIAKKKLEKKSNASLLKEKLEAETVTVLVPAGDKGRLYGTVTNVQIAEEISKKGYSIDKKSIDVKEHIKIVGKYKISVHIYHDVYAEMDLVVDALPEEKKTDSRNKGSFKKRRNDEVKETAEAGETDE